MERKENKEAKSRQTHHMDTSAREGMALQSPLGTIIYQSLLSEPQE